MRRAASFDDLVVGEPIRTFRRTVTETDLVLFTQLAGLKLPVFIDEEYCRKHTKVGTRMIPGFLTASIAAGMLDEALGPKLVAALGFDTFRFHAPLVPRDTIGAQITVRSKKELSDGKRGVFTCSVKVDDQAGREVLSFEATFMMWRAGQPA